MRSNCMQPRRSADGGMYVLVVCTVVAHPIQWLRPPLFFDMTGNVCYLRRGGGYSRQERRACTTSSAYHQNMWLYFFFLFLTDRRAAVSATQRAHPPFVCAPLRRPFCCFFEDAFIRTPATATTTNMLGLYISQCQPRIENEAGEGLFLAVGRREDLWRLHSWCSCT